MTVTTTDTTQVPEDDSVFTLVESHFVPRGSKASAQVEWTEARAEIGDKVREGLSFPSTWSQNAINITAFKYFYGDLENGEAETSLLEPVERIVDAIVEAGLHGDYFRGKESQMFREELAYILLTQRASFNSPVWFNVGIPRRTPQCSACFILSVEDEMDSILNWYVEEGKIFQRGSGAGVNLSRIRSSVEKLSGGNLASGPVSFMRGADASAGVIKSGSTSRRAAKMVILNADHPDIEEFIWCKAREEQKARALEMAGFDMSFNGADSYSTQYQNANNSVRVTDEFMQAVVDDEDWHLRAVTTGEIVRTLPARDLMRQISQAAWECADPGMQFDTTINRWHTAPNAGRINGSNPCSEYMHLDNSACNLASLNLASFLEDGRFQVDDFLHTVQVMVLAQDILVGMSSYPTEEIGANAVRFRQLGLGYANLGGLLMSMGLPYDSEEGRALARSITAALSGAGYCQSSMIAARVGPFAGLEGDKDGMKRVLEMHATHAEDEYPAGSIPALIDAGLVGFRYAAENIDVHGIRNSQISVLAPTGTIGLAMDCDTLGIEPDLSLVKHKQLHGGGTMTIANRTVGAGLKALGYDSETVGTILDHVADHGTVVGSAIADDDLGVFDCAMGARPIRPMAHVEMMAAVQPFISGAISKTVNLPEDATVVDIEDVYIRAWDMGIKAVAVYRDNCKVAQPMSSKAMAVPAVEESQAKVTRAKLPKERNSRTISFWVGPAKGYVTVGEYEDGSPGEIFLRIGKQGSTMSGITDAFAIAVSLGLQYGVPLEAFVSKFRGMRFEPEGITDDSDFRMATSLVDFVFRKMAVRYMDDEHRKEMGILTIADRSEVPEQNEPDQIKSIHTEMRVCPECGSGMIPSGSCFACTVCGVTSGCS